MTHTTVAEKLQFGADILSAFLFDPDRALVEAAKEWVHLRRERCQHSCECCDAQIASAWRACSEWRRVQQVKRDLMPSLSSLVLALSGSLGDLR